jgi:hypothetical protein
VEAAGIELAFHIDISHSTAPSKSKTKRASVVFSTINTSMQIERNILILKADPITHIFLIIAALPILCAIFYHKSITGVMTGNTDSKQRAIKN